MRAIPREPSRYASSFPGRPEQVRQVRRFLREVLAGWPRADDAVTLGSEFAANACLHSRSGIPGGVFTVRAEISGGQHTYVAVEDDGGPWDQRTGVVRPARGLDVVRAIAGDGHWGITGDAAGRIAWARLLWPGTGPLEAAPITPEAMMPISPDHDAVLELEKLAAELEARSLAVRLATFAGRLPYLEVHAPGVPASAERIFAQAGWYFWSHAERIAARDDAPTAAEVIADVLSAMERGNDRPGGE